MKKVSWQMITEQIKILLLVLAGVVLFLIPVFNAQFVGGLLCLLAFAKAQTIARGKFKDEDLNFL